MASTMLIVLALGCGLLALGAGALGVSRLRHVRIAQGSLALLLALVLASLSSVAATLRAGLTGYRALTREEVAAVVSTRPLGPQRFEAHFVLADGTERRFELAGDQLAVEARILKWHPFANQLGLHTAYELDRVAGRYIALDEERARSRTVFSLASDRTVDLFSFSRSARWLAPVIDAEYGSATFTGVDGAARYEIRVSTTGLLVRAAE
jgi:hypothetical protein